jgi:hypothetical protein
VYASDASAGTALAPPDWSPQPDELGADQRGHEVEVRPLVPEVSQLRRQAGAVARIAERIEAIQHDDWRSSTPWAQTEGVPPSAGICGLE